jgi:hypothetical protein
MPTSSRRIPNSPSEIRPQFEAVCWTRFPVVICWQIPPTTSRKLGFVMAVSHADPDMDAISRAGIFQWNERLISEEFAPSGKQLCFLVSFVMSLFVA